ncbi:toll/interleukin-1 receptor domain-containing protein [Paraburkholderia sp. BL6669N2]|uniref:toll/interleukin-1 receptor domain-containing protein n=1 Tax=Paraburkholderia sp. BL6669N2 TaxID=1938807 RepID=UPI001C6EF3D0|nr:toll/interleukin-1 receptor domain-containing protein [Paraburkholderia sp. BL6669N2]
MANQPLYELALLGNVPTAIRDAVADALNTGVEELGLALGKTVSLFIGSPCDFRPAGERCAAALCFQTDTDSEECLRRLVNHNIPIVPVASTSSAFTKEFPRVLAPLNGLTVDQSDAAALARALLECASLLPRQRRVFLSYRRTESTEAALQLYAALSARLYDVFLDTHGIYPGQHFQEVLWQRLYDSDVLLFLDTPGYFESRWTSAEFGKAQWRGIPVLRAAWPGVAMDVRAQLAVTHSLDASDFVGATGQLTKTAEQSICESVESLRTRSVTARYQQLVSTLAASVQRGGGRVEGASLRRSLIVSTPSGQKVAVYPTLGVPTTYTLHDATLDGHTPPVAVLYEEGESEEREWHAHMKWISQYLNKTVRLVDSYRSGSVFQDW